MKAKKAASRLAGFFLTGGALAEFEGRIGAGLDRVEATVVVAMNLDHYDFAAVRFALDDVAEERDLAGVFQPDILRHLLLPDFRFARSKGLGREQGKRNPANRYEDILQSILRSEHPSRLSETHGLCFDLRQTSPRP